MEQILIGTLLKYGGQVGQNTIYIVIMVWCIVKIQSLAKDKASMSSAMKQKVEKEIFDEKIAEVKSDIEKMEVSNREDHQNLFQSATEQLRILSKLEGRLLKE